MQYNSPKLRKGLQRMKLWQKMSLLNFAGVIGIASSMFVLPASTPFWLWIVSSIVVLAALNVAFYVRQRKPTSGSSPTSMRAKIIIAVGAAIWLLDILAHVLHR